MGTWFYVVIPAEISQTVEQPFYESWLSGFFYIKIVLYGPTRSGISWTVTSLLAQEEPSHPSQQQKDPPYIHAVLTSLLSQIEIWDIQAWLYLDGITH